MSRNVHDTTYLPPADFVSENPLVLRRSERVISRQGYVLNAAVTRNSNVYHPDPETVEEALARGDAKNWKNAMEAELKSLAQNQTWRLVNLPVGRKAIANKWVFKRKLSSTGEIDRYKARLVVKGCSQREGIDYAETFSPVVRYSSIRFLVSLAAKLDLDIDQMDAVTAYLQGELKEEVYMRQPAGYEDGTSKVCLLNKSIYGLKQASRTWNDKLGTALLKGGLQRSAVDTCIYFRVVRDDILFVAVYVDDLIIFSSNQKTKNSLKAHLQSTFEMTDGGEAKFVLGMHIERDRRAGTISIDQHKYIGEVLQRFNMADCNPVSTPVDVSTKLTKKMGPTDAAGREEMRSIPYQEAVGSLLFAAQVSRPDIQFAVNMVSRFSNNPGQPHWNAVKRIMRYLRGTKDKKLTYRRDSSTELHGFCDADWATDVEDRRSVTGYVFMMNDGAITWNSKKQPTVALSTTEAEYMAMSSATQEATWLRNLNIELFSHEESKTSAQSPPIQIFGDNMSALSLSDKTTSFHPRTKHIDIRHHYIRDCVNNNIVKFSHISTNEMTADILTKSLPLTKHTHCC